MIPLLNSYARSRSNTMPSSSNFPTSSNNSSSNSNFNCSNNQNGSSSKTNNSENKKSKAFIANHNRTFSKKRSLTFCSFFSPKSKATSNSLGSSNISIVDETIKATLKPLYDYNSDSNSNISSTDSNISNNQPKSSVSTSTQQINSDCTSNSSNSSIIPPFPPPSYTLIDPQKSRSSLFSRSLSAPTSFNQASSHHLNNNFILENIKESSNQFLDQVEEVNDSETNMLNNTLTNLKFNCQLAHAKEIVKISGFSTMKELYLKLSQAFNINVDQILYCTLNTNKLDMDNLLNFQVSINDIIYVHLKGRAKEIEIEKTDEVLGLTITDNSNNLCFIKKIKENSVIEKIKFINVGDHLERINNKNLVGYRHVEVAKMLKEISIGDIFILRLIEPCRDSTDEKSKKILTNKIFKNKFKKNNEVIRISSNGLSVLEEIFEKNEEVIKNINLLIEQFLGIFDNELAIQILEIGKKCSNPHEFLVAINNSDLKSFEFNEDFIYDLWGIIENAISKDKL